MTYYRSLHRNIYRSPYRSLGRLVGGAALDILAHVGTSTSPTSIGTKAVTGVGFDPKLVLPFGGYLSTNGNDIAAAMGLGAATSATNRATVTMYSQDGVTTSNTDRRHDNGKTFTSLASGGVFLEADLVSLDSDGFTLDWTATNATSRILSHVCLGGPDLEVSVSTQQMNGTGSAESWAHGLSGGPPTAILFLCSFNGTAPPNSSSLAAFGLGAWAENGTQFNAAVVSEDGLSISQTYRYLSTGSVVQATSTATNGLITQLDVSSVDATNVNLGYSLATATPSHYVYMVAMRGCKARVGTFDCNGSTSPLSIATPGVTPKLFLPIFLPGGVDSDGVVQNNHAMTIGASDGTNHVSSGTTDENIITTTNARRYTSSTSLVEYATNGTKFFEATASFVGESVLITPTTNGSTTFGQGGYLVIGT